MKEFFKKHKKKIIQIIIKSLIILAVFAIISVVAYFILRACGLTTTADFIALRDNLGDSIWFWVVVGLLQVFQVIFIPVSNQIITVPVALMFDASEVWKVWLTSWLSIWIATLLLYVIGRYAGVKLLNWLLGDKEQSDKCSKWLKRGWIFYPLGMLLPLPDDVITILSGTAKMNFLFILICSLFTRGIDTFFSTYGWGVLTKMGWWGWLILIAGNIIIWTGALVFYKLDKKNKLKLFKKNKEGEK